MQSLYANPDAFTLLDYITELLARVISKKLIQEQDFSQSS